MWYWLCLSEDAWTWNSLLCGNHLGWVSVFLDVGLY
jgi:hypothetical protein